MTLPAQPEGVAVGGNIPSISGKRFQASRSQLVTSLDGSMIVGANLQSTILRTVFVYDVASGTVLRSRYVANPSGVLSISPDHSKFMSGATLFDSSTLQVLAQENLANSPYLIATTTNFNTRTTQGGSVFSPDWQRALRGLRYISSDLSATPANVSELMFNDPDNLLINLALQFAGKPLRENGDQLG